ncbi:MAG: hypothetical protein HW387_1734 [Parachlamydiales bacterium]|nr:hypothetical protein [Parachlamydiales bacterium]
MSIQQRPEVTNYTTIPSNDRISTSELLLRTEKASQVVYFRINDEKTQLTTLKSNIQETSQLLDLARREIKSAKGSAVSAGLSILMSTGSSSSRDSAVKRTDSRRENHIDSLPATESKEQNVATAFTSEASSTMPSASRIEWHAPVGENGKRAPMEKMGVIIGKASDAYPAIFKQPGLGGGDISSNSCNQQRTMAEKLKSETELLAEAEKLMVEAQELQTKFDGLYANGKEFYAQGFKKLGEALDLALGDKRFFAAANKVADGLNDMAAGKLSWTQADAVAEAVKASKAATAALAAAAHLEFPTRSINIDVRWAAKSAAIATEAAALAARIATCVPGEITNAAAQAAKIAAEVATKAALFAYEVAIEYTEGDVAGTAW